jgi:hypothetical protein
MVGFVEYSLYTVRRKLFTAMAMVMMACFIVVVVVVVGDTHSTPLTKLVTDKQIQTH